MPDGLSRLDRAQAISHQLADGRLRVFQVALKKIPNAFEDTEDVKRLLREIRLLRFFDHENVPTLILHPSAAPHL